MHHFKFISRGEQPQAPQAREPEPCDVAPDYNPDNVPAYIRTAFNFIGMCNQKMGLHEVTYPNGAFDPQTLDVREEHLHPSQEKAFTAACDAMTSFFIQGMRHARK